MSDPAPGTPVPTNDRLPVLIGCGLWTVLLLLTLLMREELASTGRGWWAWTCAAGLALGLSGLAYLQVRHARASRKQRD